MLEEISIANLGVIREARLPFTPGLTVISGETGHGKTMVLSSLHLLLGRRASASVVRHGAAHASVEGCWSTAKLQALPAILDTGAVVEEEQLFINRTVQQDGKSRAVLGGKSTPASVLASIGENLVNIHGQADQLRLRSPQAQREALDLFGGASVAEKLESYRGTYQAWKQAKKHLEEVQANRANYVREFHELKRFLDGFEALNPEAEEFEELEALIARLSHFEALSTGVGSVMQVLSPEETYEAAPILEQLGDVVASLHKLASYDGKLVTIAESFEAHLDGLENTAQELESYLENFDGDAVQQLEEAQERLVELTAFARKHGLTHEELFSYQLQAEERVKLIDPEALDFDTLEAEVQELETELTAKSQELTAERRLAAGKLAEQVNEELAGLAMGGNKLSLIFNEVRFTSSGGDEVEFMLTHPGSPEPRPVSKAASGGELSRIMLALEVVLADPKRTPTFVFDEVDSGVGGATAEEIGKRLAKLAREAQVIVVSHLAQVAVYADNHLVVKKEVSDDSTETHVKQLSSDERIVEIARMLSGKSSSETGQAHALELLTSSRDYKEKLD